MEWCWYLRQMFRPHKLLDSLIWFKDSDRLFIGLDITPMAVYDCDDMVVDIWPLDYQYVESDI